MLRFNFQIHDSHGLKHSQFSQIAMGQTDHLNIKSHLETEYNTCTCRLFSFPFLIFAYDAVDSGWVLLDMCVIYIKSECEKKT